MIDIAAQIPPRAKKVVELGCLREKAGEAFLRIQPKAEYWGVTDDLAELKEAGSFLTHVVLALPEEVDFEKLGIFEADVIIIRGNFFRNLTAARLQKWAQVLAEEGQILLDVPNPAYIRNYLELIAGERSGDAVQGISAAAARKLLEEAGLYMHFATAYYNNEQDEELRHSQENRNLMEGLKGVLTYLGWQALKENDPWLKSFFFKAGKRKLEPQDKLVVQTVVGESIVTAKPRVHLPNAFLATEQGVLARAVDRTLPFGKPVPDEIKNRVLIRQRLSYMQEQQAYQILDGMRKGGHLIVAEIDDNPRAFIGKGNEAVYSLSYLCTHCVQVSTEYLADVLRQYNPHVQVFPNQLQELPEKRNYLLESLQKLKAGEDYVTFFFGALNRTEEWQEVMPVICEAIEKYGSKLRFKVLSDRGFYEALPTEYKEFIGSREMYEGQFVPYHMYAEALHSSDISFLPLRDNDFNRAKSDLKFIESAGHGAAVLASPTVYENTVKEGRNGFIYRNPREFKEYLTLLIEDRERRIETAEAAYRYVQEERLMSGHYLERLAWYREMLQRRPQLDRELMQRLADWQNKYKKKGKGVIK